MAPMLAVSWLAAPVSTKSALVHVKATVLVAEISTGCLHSGGRLVTY